MRQYLYYLLLIIMGRSPSGPVSSLGIVLNRDSLAPVSSSVITLNKDPIVSSENLLFPAKASDQNPLGPVSALVMPLDRDRPNHSSIRFAEALDLFLH
ncbi:unnamed protein product [Acanthocheilonema viteae]|uniref:Uncharacterized protein n=1 Tax=Acanthocheilonema viteae TaxID=6277 RepID=A0A498SB90_ACAVI|nr:unnamed protein product [Acanthocheilonema viteae]